MLSQKIHIFVIAITDKAINYIQMVTNILIGDIQAFLMVYCLATIDLGIS
jgi:hypothetical protein